MDEQITQRLFVSNIFLLTNKGVGSMGRLLGRVPYCDLYKIEKSADTYPIKINSIRLTRARLVE